MRARWRHWTSRVRRAWLRWRTDGQRETAIRYLDMLADALEARGWRCARTYRPVVIVVRTPLLRVYDDDGVPTMLSVLAVPGGRWGVCEAPRGRGGFLCHCGGDGGEMARMVEWFLRERMALRRAEARR
ncbi:MULTISPECIES: hypothetical protein [Actinomadura]|uniref:Uncharacterized protein n=1 Tax=Actinomadura litoris TaxID=2678616 RepID=A0A7K1KW32_9ACTN|nr:MULTISPECIES: hypothetical protein [Actinomadura]MBT2211339.1 hypothetical protein [Actinomadura sp. NEAU-AAG7]MUN36255.1 hypothetical protein [Actinomadura litoris]